MLMPSRHHQVKEYFDNDVSCFTSELCAIEQIVDSRETARHDSEYDRLLQAINDAMQACAEIEQTIGDDQELLEETRSRFRKLIAPWFNKSQWMSHATTKPQGYPGDYKMLLSIYGGQTPSPGIGAYLDLYFLNTELGRAVPARMKCVKEFLEQQLQHRIQDTTILDVACGPCQEFAQQQIPLELDHDIQVTFLDFDQDALDYVEENIIAPRADRDHFHCIRYNALRMRSAERFVKQFGKFDIIYSVGLCDYIENRLLVPMLSGWREMTNEDGVVFVAFKDQARYDKNVYQWLVDWHFLQRSKEDCFQVLEEAGYDIDQVEMTRDETGIIMNFTAPTGITEKARIDQAHAPEKRPIFLESQDATSSTSDSSAMTTD
jgi:extracellular factor (EF) 3-hydroxypalmitic acid methyl ester biosynthesis protein